MAILLGYRGEQHVPRALESGQLSGHCGLRIWLNAERPVAIDPSATLGSTQESARSHLIGGMVRPGGDVLSLRTCVQLPQHVSDELLHVLMATVVEGDARALPACLGARGAPKPATLL